MKKILALLLACVMVLSVALTGCSSSSSDSDDADTEDSTEEEEDEESEDTEDTEDADETAEEDADPDHIIVTYLYATSEPSALEEIQDAVNEISIADLNVEVEFKSISMSDSTTNYSLWISSGETVDLMMLAFQDIKTYANSGQIQPLDDLINEEDTPTLYELANTYPILATVSGVTYGFSQLDGCYGDRPGVIMRSEYLEETGLEKEDGEYYTLDDLTEIFAAIKENHEDCYPYGLLGSGISSGTSIYTLLLGADAPGDNILAGALMDTSSAEVVNLFETDEYKEYLQTVAEWYDAGYVMPDAATTDSSATELMTNGKIACYVMSIEPNQTSANNYGFELTGLATDTAAIGASSASTNWTVPITSENPEAAMKWMDYVYENTDLCNLIQYGIEGEHYQITDEENGLIDFADGVDASTSTYYNSLGLWGNKREIYTFDTVSYTEANEEFTEEALENQYASYGFVFDSSDVESLLTTCQTVLDQYQAALETGSLGTADWEATYETMISQLESAGIDQIIAECQAQLDEYLAG